MIPESSFGTDSMMSVDLQIADEDIKIEDGNNQISSIWESEMFIPGNLINKSTSRSEVMKNL